MVDMVEHVTFAGKRAKQMGQDVLYITERCVMRLGDQGLVAIEIMPGIDPERDIVAASDSRVQISPDAVGNASIAFENGPDGVADMSAVSLTITFKCYCGTPFG